MKENKGHNKHTKARRKLLKTSIVGAGAIVAGKSLPEQWARPVVESITLPAHAQTSLLSVSGGIMGTIIVTDASDWLLDKLVPSAMAGVFPGAEASVLVGQVCVQDNGDGTVNVQALFQYASYYNNYPYFTGTNIPANTTTALVMQNTPCNDSTFTCTVNVVLAGGSATGAINIEETALVFGDDSTAQFEFNLMDPGCLIELPVPPCVG